MGKCPFFPIKVNNMEWNVYTHLNPLYFPKLPTENELSISFTIMPSWSLGDQQLSLTKNLQGIIPAV